MLKEIRCELCNFNHQEVVYQTLREYKNNNREQPYLISEPNSVPPNKILRCTRCGLTFVVPEQKQNAQSLLSFYAEMVDYEYVEEEMGRRMAARNVITKLNKFKKYGNRLLDVGCSTGFFLDEARKNGWEVYGIEPSRWAAEYAKEKFHLDVYNTTLENIKFDRGYFNVVIMQDVIEHLLNPKEALIKIRHILKLEGILYIHIPDIESLASRILKTKWWGINQFTFYYFSKNTLNKLLKSAGFKFIEMSLYTRLFSLKYLAERIKTFNKVLYSFLKFILRVCKLENKLFWINLKDEIEIFAREENESIKK